MELKRQMGFGSYQTAWTWLHKIRKAMVRPARPRLQLWSKVVDGLGGEGRRILVMSSHPFAEGSDTPWIRITSSAFAAQTIERKIR
jgi:hypothetical protein